MMTPEQSDLYQRLQAFELDDQTHEFGFTRHLMKSHGWTVSYAMRSIEEYKKFVFLTVAVDHQVLPSDAVDQVWHAHVLLTQSYWEEFCPLVLQKNLHHHPARGGKAERAEFHLLYEQTIESYRHFFDEPPVEIWAPAYLRFGTELKQQRVNSSEYWIIPKQLPDLVSNFKFSRSIFFAVGVGFVAVGCTGQQVESVLFIAIVIAIAAVPILIIQLLRYLLRLPESQPQMPTLDVYELAYLVGGRTRAAELAIASLVNQGYLIPNVRHKTFTIVKVLPDSAPLLEKQVMREAGRSLTLKELRQSVEKDIAFLTHGLQEKQMILKGIPAKPTNISFIILLLLMSIPLLIVSSSGQNDFVAFLWILWLFGLVIGLCLNMPSQRTIWADRVLMKIKQEQDVHNMMQSFALSGYEILSGGVLDDLKQVFHETIQDESSACGCGC